MDKKKAIIKDVKKLVKKYDGKLSRPRYFKEGNFEVNDISNNFGSWKALMEVMGLDVYKETKQLRKALAKHVTSDIHRKYYEEEVLPWCGKYQKSKKTGIATIMTINDIHDVDVDDFTLEVFIDTVKRIQPDHVVINGDGFDCPEFGKYTKDPRLMDPVKRFKFMHERVLAPLRKAAPDAEFTFIIGNHEYRLLKYMAEKCPALMVLMSDFHNFSLKDLFGLDKYEIDLVCKSDLAAWTKPDTRKELKKNYKVFYDCFVLTHEKNLGFKMDGASAHTHRASITDHKAEAGGYLWYVYPAASVQDASYMEGLNSSDCGFGIAHIDIAKKEVQQKIIITSKSFVIVEGKLYRRKK